MLHFKSLCAPVDMFLFVREREHTFTLTFAMSTAVRLSSVTFVRPTQPVEIFGNVSTHLVTTLSTR